MKDLTLPAVRLPRAQIADHPGFAGVVEGDCLRGIPQIEGGRLVGLRPAASEGPAPILLPPLVDPHVHLDKCHTIGRLGPVGGDLLAAIEAQAQDKANWTADDLRARASQGLTELYEAGARIVRSHVDWGDDPLDVPLAYTVFRELAHDWKVRLDLQLAPLTGINQLAEPGVADAIARKIAPDNAALGAFVLHHQHAEAGIRAAFAAADKYGLALDFHVDEGLDTDLNGVALIAEIAKETGFQGAVLCGHGCALMSQPDDVPRVADLLAATGVALCPLPATNLYLQARTGQTPDRRGIAPIHELMARGVRIVTGADNVADAFCPLGRHDPRHSLHLLALAAHLDPPYDRWLPMISTDAATALGIDAAGLVNAPLDTLLSCDAPTLAHAIAGDARLTPAQETV